MISGSEKSVNAMAWLATIPWSPSSQVSAAGKSLSASFAAPVRSAIAGLTRDCQDFV